MTKIREYVQAKYIRAKAHADAFDISMSYVFNCVSNIISAVTLVKCDNTCKFTKTFLSEE